MEGTLGVMGESSMVSFSSSSGDDDRVGSQMGGDKPSSGTTAGDSASSLIVPSSIDKSDKPLLLKFSQLSIVDGGSASTESGSRFGGRGAGTNRPRDTRSRLSRLLIRLTMTAVLSSTSTTR